MFRLKNVLFRTGAVVAAALGLTVAAAATAGAAGPQPIAPTELSKATTAAHSPTALHLLSKIPAAGLSGTAKSAPTVASDTHPIYALNPAFVRDASAPVATFWYAATSATKSGQALTVFTAPDSSGTWQPVNIASGNTESRMITAAHGATLFTEPQIGAWYALTATQVRPLNLSAKKAIGPNPITIKAYQALVSTRYSDKLPGSTYNAHGVAGGYDTTARSTAASPAPSFDSGLIAAAGAATALLAGLLVYRRKTA
ncbi:hypothetical protein AB0E69_10280 [Kribbella sp. NPDC026611]|uniref:hypothetical protein n=1 Tax=Kribbella sp. NPDC026611 TaxID=3154911 RepID=UPI0033D578B8